VKVAGTYTGAAAGITQILLVFATVAVLVCGLVIANTFTVLLAQRVRELALLRCVGATGRQLRRGALIESVITGVAASALGVLAGICMAAGVSALAGRFNSPIPLAGVSVGAQSILIGMAVGVAVTVVAAYAPARRATRVAPLAALRPQDPPSVRTRVGLLRRAAGLLLLIPGGAVLGYGAAVGNLLIALPGGVLSFIGIILLSAWLVPPVVTGIGRLIGPAGRVPGELAALNATRNPQRTASTAIALIIGVTLTTTMVVGAASTRASASSLLDDAFPTDVVIENNSSAPLPQSLGRAVSTVPDVRAVLALPSALVHGPGTDAQVLGIDPAAAAGVVRSTEGAGVPEPGTISVPDYLGSDWKVHEGGSVPLSVGTSRLSLRVHLVSSDTPVSMTATDLAKLAPTAGIGEIWVRLASGLDADGRSDALDNISGAATDLAPGSNVQGASEERDGFDKLVNTLLLVVTGLLAVAVVIAVIGVGNTMALSVLERRQESGLLRALGLTRTQLRWMLLWEALLIAGVAALLGTVLGACYGALGTSAALSAAGSIRVVIPWSQLLAIVVVATAAGALASVLPSRRAARTPPVVAIAG
jgi:putative ABC transport system permease protein